MRWFHYFRSTDYRLLSIWSGLVGVPRFCVGEYQCISLTSPYSIPQTVQNPLQVCIWRSLPFNKSKIGSLSDAQQTRNGATATHTLQCCSRFKTWELFSFLNIPCGLFVPTRFGFRVMGISQIYYHMSPYNWVPITLGLQIFRSGSRNSGQDPNVPVGVVNPTVINARDVTVFCHCCYSFC